MPSAHREIERLINAGLVREQRIGRQRLVSANPGSSYFEPLRTLLHRAFGPPTVLADALRGVTGLRFAAIYGSYAARRVGEEGPAPNDIDLLVVGDVDASQVYEAVENAERQLSLPVNATVLSDEEWAADTGFTRQLRARPLLRLGDDDIRS